MVKAILCAIAGLAIATALAVLLIPRSWESQSPGRPAVVGLLIVIIAVVGAFVGYELGKMM
jgi:hypothetical protein